MRSASLAKATVGDRLTLLSESSDLEGVGKSLLQLPGLGNVAARVDGNFLCVGLEVALAERPGGGVDRASEGSGKKGGDGKEGGGEHYERSEWGTMEWVVGMCVL